jgi:hypothetical protein
MALDTDQDKSQNSREGVALGAHDHGITAWSYAAFRDDTKWRLRHTTFTHYNTSVSSIETGMPLPPHRFLIIADIEALRIVFD